MHTSMRSKYTGIKDEFQKAIGNSLTMHLCGLQSAQLSSSHRCTPNIPLPLSHFIFHLTCLHYFSRSMLFLEFVWSGRVGSGMVWFVVVSITMLDMFSCHRMWPMRVFMCFVQINRSNAMQLIRSLPTHLYH